LWPDARDIADELTGRGVTLSLGGIEYAPDPVGRLLFNVLRMVTEFKSDLIPQRNCSARLCSTALIL
jgi:hypothetical protein